MLNLEPEALLGRLDELGVALSDECLEFFDAVQLSAVVALDLALLLELCENLLECFDLGIDIVALGRCLGESVFQLELLRDRGGFGFDQTLGESRRELRDQRTHKIAGVS